MKTIVNVTLALLVVSITATAQAKPDFPVIDATIANLRKGSQPTRERVEKCDEEQYKFSAALAKKYGTWRNTEFGPEDQYELYIVMLKMALVQPNKYGSSPFRSSLRLTVAEELKTRTETSEDPFLHFCAIIPSLSQDDVEHAISCFKMLQKNDSFLAKIAIEWIDERMPESETKTAFISATKEP